MLTIYFYTTSACHLCDTANELLLETKIPLNVIPIEIANDDQLILEYGTRIPVLKRADTQLELAWPFNSNELNVFIT